MECERGDDCAEKQELSSPKIKSCNSASAWKIIHLQEHINSVQKQSKARHRSDVQTLVEGAQGHVLEYQLHPVPRVRGGGAHQEKDIWMMESKQLLVFSGQQIGSSQLSLD